MTNARARTLGSLLLTLALAGCGALVPAHYRIAAARKDLEKGDWRGASVELRSVIDAHPQNAAAWLLLTRLSLDANDPADAPADLDHALACGAKGPEVDALRVRTWLETGQPKAALAALGSHTIRLTEPEESLAMARAYLALGQTDATLERLQPLLAAHPDLTEARVVMAEALARRGQLDAALQQLETAMQRDPKAPDPPLLKGRILAAGGQFPEAESALQLALERMSPSEPVPHRLTALVTLTRVHLAQGELDAAAKSQALLAQLAPGAAVTQVLDARLKVAHGDLQDGIDELERVVANVPSYTEARMLLGGALLDGGDLEQAQEQLEQVVQQAPDNLEARKLLATVRLKLNEPEAALSVLTPELSSQAGDPQLLALLGAAATRLGDSQGVMTALTTSEQAHPGNEALRLNLAQAYLSAGQPGKALALLEKAPGSNDLRRDALLIAALAGARGPGPAGEEVDRLLAAHPNDAGVLGIAGTYYASQGALERARALLDQAVKSDPRNAMAVIELARIEATTGDSGTAQGTLRAALAANPSALPVRFALADLLTSEKAFSEAISLLKAAGQPRAEPSLEFALARVYLVEGDLKSASAALDRAIASQPGQTALVEDAGTLLLAAHQYDAALARFAQATRLAPDNALYWYSTARAQLALNEPLAARSSLEKAAQLRPNWLPVVGTLALMDLHEHKGPSALDRVNALLASDPHDPGALALEGEVESSLGSPSVAMTAFGEAQRLRPSAAVAVKEFEIELASHQAQPQEPLEQWLARQPNDWQVRTVLGNYYLEARQLRPAAQAFQAVVQLVPDDVVALNNLAWIDGKLGEPHALALAERAHQLAPQSPGIDDTLGWILARSGEAARAVPLLAQAVKGSPSDPDMQYHYAYALAQTGQRAEARQLLSKLLATHSSFDSHSDAERLLAATRT